MILRCSCAVAAVICVLFAVSNAVVTVREQSVKCNPQMMHIFFEFSEPFNGVVYADQFFNSQLCKAVGTGERRLAVNIPRNSDPSVTPFCGVQVDKAQNQFYVTLIVSESRDILVEGMKTFDVQCHYIVQDFTVSLSSLNALSIKAPSNDQPHDPSTVIKGEGKAILPLLDMSIRRGHGLDGPKISSATIGERITLDIALVDSTNYDMRVYNCIAHDGSRTPAGTVELIDSQGCTKLTEKVVEDRIFERIDKSGKHVFAYVYGFQFSTSDLVYFECQIKPCLSRCNTSQCNKTGVTFQRMELADHVGLFERPDVAVAYSLRQQQPSVESSELSSSDTSKLEDFNLHTKLRISSQFASNRLRDDHGVANLVDSSDNLIKSESHLICMQQSIVGSLVGLFVCAIVAVVFAVAFIVYKLRRDRKAKSVTTVMHSPPNVLSTSGGTGRRSQPSSSTVTCSPQAF